MKETFKIMLFALLLMISLMSCNKEELFVEPVTEIIEDNNEDTEEVVEDLETPPVLDASLPCDFVLNDVQPNTTVIINCVLDLQGQIVNLPPNVTINYEGGEIINGTLNFSDNSIIDGNLLNNTLTISGSTPQLKDPVFQFIPNRWGIVEGKVSDEVALNNKNILNDIFEQTHNLGITTFKIDAMDAYFKVSKEQNFLPSYRRGDIFLPSDFNLVMTDNTHLRVQPNNYNFFILLSILDVSNVTITGGNLHGDRDEHDFSSCGGEAWCQDSALLGINAGVNITIDDVNISDSTADGILLAGIGFSFNPDYEPSKDVLIKNCVIDKSRRNNISIVNADGVVIENCEILNAGITTSKSVGTLPKCGIDIEALRSIDSNGNYVYYELAKNIIIRNNFEKGSFATAILVAIGDDTVIENNLTENSIGYSLATGIKIRNNTIDGTIGDIEHTGSAIGAGVPDTETTFNNEISGNTVRGYGTGISLYAKGAEIFNNTIENANTGIFSKAARTTNIYNNIIKSNIADSRGFAAHLASLDEIVINNNLIDVLGYPVTFINVNYYSGQENQTVTVSNNTFISPKAAQVSNSNGIILVNNN